MANERHVTIPYAPRKIFLPFHERKQRWSATVAHRRAGKTVARINDLIKAALLNTRTEPRYAYIAPTYAQAKDVAWSYLARYTAPIPGAVPSVHELRVDLPNGGRVRLYGADNYDRLRGIYLDGLVLDEYGLIDPRAWLEVLRPTLADRQGWADFVGTPAGRNHFSDLCELAKDNPEWYFARLRASETGLLRTEELNDARKMMTEEQYAAEFECSFDAAVVGSYYGKEIARCEADKRIDRVPYEPRVPVHTAWDLGIGDSTAIWFSQNVGREIRVIDYLEGAGQSLAFYAGELRAKGYSYGTHVLPHDAAARELTSGQSREETLRTLGFNNLKVLSAENIANGINGARMLLPRCWFDKEKCARGLEALRNYRREWDEKKKVFHDRPLHDWSSHAADAFRYLAMGLPEDRKPNKIKYPEMGIV